VVKGARWWYVLYVAVLQLHTITYICQSSLHCTA
jgi:hypothetical protein